MALVRKHLDPKHPPRPTDEEARRYDALSDEDIDYSDIPDLSQAGFPRVDLDERGRIVAVYVPVDPDVLAWFMRRDPKGFEHRMAHVLAEHVRENEPEER